MHLFERISFQNGANSFMSQEAGAIRRREGILKEDMPFVW